MNVLCWNLGVIVVTINIPILDEIKCWFYVVNQTSLQITNTVKLRLLEPSKSSDLKQNLGI